MKSFSLEEILNLAQLPDKLSQLDRFIAQASPSSDQLVDKIVKDVIKKKSKRLRPALLLSIVLLQKHEIDEKTLNAGSSVELLHLASLVHDDIIDKSALRWGKPTTAASQGLPAAIIAGDYLFALSCHQASQLSKESSELIASTYMKMCEGQYLELTDKHNLKRSKKSALECSSLKTGALFSAACRLGGICANLKQEQVEKLDVFGRFFGLSFQLIDDILDYLSSSKLLGKPVGADLKEGVYNLPVVLSLKTTKSNQLEQLIRNKANYQKVADFLIESGSISKSLTIINGYNLQAEQALKNDPSLVKLTNLPSEYLKWSINTKVLPKYLKLLKV